MLISSFILLKLIENEREEDKGIYFIMIFPALLCISVNTNIEPCRVGNNEENNKSFKDPSFRLILGSIQRVSGEAITIFIVDIITIIIIYIDVNAIVAQ